MLYDLTVVQFSKMLGNLNAILEKGKEFAEEKKFDVDVLLNSRLAPDQFNLIRQVQIACDTAKLSVARLAGKVDLAPKHEDNETTIEQLQERIKSVQEYLSSFTKEDFSTAESQKIDQPRWKEKFLEGKEFAIQHATPNIYFHVTTVYAILRHNGVNVGKKDYLGNIPFKS